MTSTEYAMQNLADTFIEHFDGHLPTISAHVKNLEKRNPSVFMKLVKQRIQLKKTVTTRLERESVMNELMKNLRTDGKKA